SATDPDNSGWLAHLQRFYDRRMDVLNRGFAQHTSSDARKIAHQILPKTNTNTSPGLSWTGPRLNSLPRQDGRSSLHLLIIAFGANDAVPDETSPQHVPLTMYAENLRYIVSLLRSPDSEHYSPHTRILFVTPPPVGDLMYAESTHIGSKVPRKNQVTRMYAEAMNAVAGELGLPCVDLWSAIEFMVKKAVDRVPLVAAARTGILGTDQLAVQSTLKSIYGSHLSPVSPFGGYEMYLADGFALNANGNRLLHKLLISKILTTWPELRPY
ncbi:isoamyl acetate-hydrolyzing esterase, partial [Coemansia aciculifera]